ncbi:hypothetical protein ABEB36_010387 [Hypothenemus hampei]
MRNIRISAPLDGSPLRGEISPEANKYRKQANLPLLPQGEPAPNALSLPQSTPQPIVSTARSVEPLKLTTQPTIKPACASCGLIATQKPESPQSRFPFQNSIFRTHNAGSTSEENTFNSSQYDNTAPTSGSEIQPEQDKLRQLSNEQNVSNVEDTNSPQVNEPRLEKPQYQQISGPQNTNYVTPEEKANSLQTISNSRTIERENEKPEDVPQSVHFSEDNVGPGKGLINEQNDSQGETYPIVNPLQLPGQKLENSVSTLPPVSVADGVIHVGGGSKQDIPIQDKFPGMQNGLPEGVDEKDVTDLLYKFHYTVGFHGHYEKGLKNGAKIGGYFVNGRDGISRVVTYIADENGFRPKVKFINLGLESEDTPKAETEKTFGLKSFEFVWYPIS